MTLVSRIVRGRKAAPATPPTDWRQWPEWQRATSQADNIKAQTAVAESDYAAAQEKLTALRADRDRADLDAILGDAPGQAAEALTSSVPGAERAVADAARRVGRYQAAGREMDIRLVELGEQLKQRFAAEWRLAYRDGLARAAHAAREAAMEQGRLVELWELAAVEHRVDAGLPGPTAALLPNHPSSAVSPWLAAVRAAGVDA